MGIEWLLSKDTSELVGNAKEEFIDELESTILYLNKKAMEGFPEVSDGVYDTLVDMLRELNPSSEVLATLWTEDDENAKVEDVDKFLIEYPMLSIQTVKSLKDKFVQDFKELLPSYPIDLCFSIKENGHAVRVVYQDGVLVKATTRGRSTLGRDITRQMKVLLGKVNESLQDFGLVELRGEVVLPFENLEQARAYNPSIKSAFSGVASMLRDSASDEEISLLRFVCFDILSDIIEFDTWSGKFEFLRDIGFEVPIFVVLKTTKMSLEQVLQEGVNELDSLTSEYDYYTDGVVVYIDNIELFNQCGVEDKYRLGNMALKIGRWKQDMYSGVIEEIRWDKGKYKNTPVAVLKEGVLTATGNTVKNVPLYAPLYILLLEAYPNRVIHFRYGGEAGVVPVTSDGRLVVDIVNSLDTI